MKSAFHSDTIKKLPKELQDEEVGQILNDWFFYRKARHFGPVDTDFIQNCLVKGHLDQDTYIWRPGLEEWKPIKEFKSFSAYISKESKVNLDNETFLRDTGLIVSDQIGLKNLNFDKNLVQSVEESKVQTDFVAPAVYKIAALALGLMIAVGSYVYLNKKPAFFESISPLDQSSLQMISNKMSNKGQKVRLYVAQKQSGQESLVLISNKLKGKTVRIELFSQKDSIIGRYRDAASVEQKITSKFIDLGKIYKSSGDLLSPGIYNVVIRCLDCGVGSQKIYSSKTRVNSESLKQYEIKLKDFKASVADFITLEVDEFSKILSFLEGQLEDTEKKYINAKQTSWRRFSSNWTESHKEASDLLAQVEQANIQEKIYFLPLYYKANEISEKILNLHDLQSRSVKDRRFESYSLETNEIRKNINLVRERFNKEKRALDPLYKNVSGR